MLFRNHSPIYPGHTVTRLKIINIINPCPAIASFELSPVMAGIIICDLFPLLGRLPDMLNRLNHQIIYTKSFSLYVKVLKMFFTFCKVTFNYRLIITCSAFIMPVNYQETLRQTSLGYR